MRAAILFILAAGLAIAQPTEFPELKLTDGTLYSAVTVIEVQPDGLKISHDSGLAKIPFEKLPPEILSKFPKTTPPPPLWVKDTVTTHFEEKIEDTEDFFQKFVNSPIVLKRDQFETEEEFRARIPKPVDTSKIYYFTADEGASVSYSIETSELTVMGGWAVKGEDIGYHSYDMKDAPPLIIKTVLDDQGTYIASNLYGKEVEVKKSHVHDYIFHITNPIEIRKGSFLIPSPDKLREGHVLSIRVKIDRDKAKSLSENLRIVIGVKLAGQERSVTECTKRMEPKIDNPREVSWFAHGFDAEIVEIRLIDPTTNTQYARASKSR
jgi:hypothetical protein